MKRRKFVESAGVVGGLLVAGCTGESGAGDSNREDAEFFDLEGGVGEKSEGGGLTVTNLRLFKTAAGTGIMGTLKNISQDIYTRVSVRVILRDENDDPVQSFNESIGVDLAQGVDTEAIGDLKPGQTWQFSVFFEDISLENVASYRVIVSGEVA